jgi:2-hydroxy-6-oxo-6-(2'-aminophenyl)hexa-2,4-dienoate hydrolase
MATMHDFRSEYVDAGGIRTHYLEAGSGPPLVLIHGGGSGADAYGNWRDCIPLYAPKFRTFAVDMVGFGKTAKPDPASYGYTQKGRNEHIAAFIRALDVGPVSLIGNSMGGATALGVAMTRPELVSRLVLMGAGGLKGAGLPRPALKAIVEYDFTVEGMRRLVDALTGSRYQPTDEMIRYRYELSVQPDTRAALEVINAKVKQGDMAYEDDQIKSVKTPTLVVNGKEDQVSTLARANLYIELLENSWAYFVPHCGHWVMIESPRDFVAVTTNFLLSDGLSK